MKQKKYDTKTKDKSKLNKITIAVDYSKLPNPWHFQQVLKGGKIHKSEKNLIPRKKKYKDKVVNEYE